MAPRRTWKLDKETGEKPRLCWGVFAAGSVCCRRTQRSRAAAGTAQKRVSVKVLLDFSGLYCLSAKAEKPISAQTNYSLNLQLLRSLILEAFQLISRVWPVRNNIIHKETTSFWSHLGERI